jgi:acyl-CoA thioesterase
MATETGKMLLMDPDELAYRCAEAMYERDSASQEMGIKLRENRAGHAVLEMEITKVMANGGGICHGGYLFSLADTAMAYASNSRNDVYVAVSASIEFLAAGRIGQTVSALATEEHRAGRTATYTVAVSDDTGQAIAQFLGRTYRVRGSVLEGPRDSTT